MRLCVSSERRLARGPAHPVPGGFEPDHRLVHIALTPIPPHSQQPPNRPGQRRVPQLHQWTPLRDQHSTPPPATGANAQRIPVHRVLGQRGVEHHQRRVIRLGRYSRATLRSCASQVTTSRVAANTEGSSPSSAIAAAASAPRENGRHVR